MSQLAKRVVLAGRRGKYVWYCLGCFTFSWWSFFSLFCIEQTDWKSLIAYFSVSHVCIKQLMNKQIPKNYYCLEDTGLLGCDFCVLE